MSALSPMIGFALPFHARNTWYVNVSSAFETPTTTELGNKPDSSSGLNPDLKPQYSWTYESGMKGNMARLRYDVALYSTRVRDELIPFDIGNGRTAFRNAGRTARRGVEVASGTQLGPLELTSAYTYSRFRFRDFLSGTTQYAGNVIPGIPEHQGQFSATWRARRGFAVAEWTAKSKVYVNDANAAAAPGYALLNIRVGGTAAFGRPWLTPVVGVQNLFDRKYVSSVAVNAAGTVTTAKSYEPGPGRTWFVGFSAGSAPW
jgi:iron complex outermembrane receptor protein